MWLCEVLDEGESDGDRERHAKVRMMVQGIRMGFAQYIRAQTIPQRQRFR